MLESLRKRLEKDDEGFTLIELMVVVLIIAILIAIAIPTFLGARERAQDRAAQSDIRNAFTAEKVIYTDDQAYTTSAAALTAVEPSLSFTPGATVTDNGTVYVHVTSAGGVDTLYLGKASASGDCFYLRDIESSGTTYARATSCGDMTSATYTANGW